MTEGDARSSALTPGAIAGAAAAVMHGAAVGIHADHADLARLFVALATAQAAVAVAALVRPGRPAAVALVAVNAGAAGGWLITRLTGISWIGGLEVAESPQLADTVAATFALIAAIVGVTVLVRRSTAPVRGRVVGVTAAMAGVLLVPGLVDATAHRDHAATDHAADDVHGAVDDPHEDLGGSGIAAVDPDGEANFDPAAVDGTGSADGHDDHADDHADDRADIGHDEGRGTGEHDSDDRAAGEASVAPPARPGSGEPSGPDTGIVSYDPELPIDLGGVEGVTPRQQAFAENLVGATVRDLPQWADPAVAEAAGFRSIGDGFTGHEHYIQWDWIDDDVWLDPNHPESLVYEAQPDGGKRLVSAMFMLPSGTPLDEVPDWGGALMQWHVHGDLCFTDDPDAPRVAGVKPVGGTCSAPLVDGTMAPMIHVWIRAHECGPFAALDGIAGGQVPEGEAVRCHH